MIASPAGTDNMPEIILPRKLVQELRKLIDGSDNDILVNLSARVIRFASGKTILTSKLIDGQFPDYKRAILINNSKTLAINPKVLAKVIDRVATISTEKTRIIKIKLDNNCMTLSIAVTDGGHGAETIDIEYNDDPIELGFNFKYLLDAMQHLNSDIAHFIFSATLSPVHLQDPTDINTLYVLMPMRV